MITVGGAVNFAAVARRFEAKHLQLTLALSTEAMAFGDECAAAFAGAEAYSNRITGAALAPEHIDPAIAFFDARGADTKLEVSSYASPALIAAVNARGFELRFFTHVLAMPVRNVSRLTPPAGITIERLDRSDLAAVRAAAIHNDRCFATDRDVSEVSVGLTMKHLLNPTNDTFVAKARGEIVGVGCSESSHGVTLVFGGAVRPDLRGRGLQQALINVRVANAAERGSEVICVMAGPGTQSERNALRAGFQIVGTRAFFVRPLRLGTQ
jgi:ribosomal protein S18 acetylase RimI-like enzyme